MDFKSLISKIESIDGKIETPKAPEVQKAVQLNEDAQLRVLAGQSSYIAEAKKKAEEKKEEEVEEGFDSNAKPGDTFKTAKGTATKTKTGLVHTKDKYDYDPGSDDKDDKKRKEKARKTAKESVDTEAFKAKFSKMVEGKKADKKDEKPKAKKDKKMEEGAKPDFLDMDKDGNKKEPMKKAVADKKKKPVKESVEKKLTFKQMVQLVQESGGQQQIDAVDTELFNWAQRVAVAKLGEGMKADLYAGLIYERNGGSFEMYDVLSEDQK